MSVKPLADGRSSIPVVQRRKLIEVALPLEAISEATQAEKNRKVGKPQNLHLWWARKPVTAARAFLLAQLLDDPSSDPVTFPTVEEQAKERDRLHRLIVEAIQWDNMSDTRILNALHREIERSIHDSIVVTDPFIGGGSLMLEAQRLGLTAVGSDINPVAVLLSSALVEIPSKFVGLPPVLPGLAGSQIRHWAGCAGLAADVRAFGEWMRAEAAKRIGDHYPASRDAEGVVREPLAWVWARTVICPSPACGIEAPLVSKWWLAKKRGREAFVVPSVVADSRHPSGNRVQYEIAHDEDGPPVQATMSGLRGGVCVACQSSISKEYVKAEGRAGRMSAALLARVLEGKRRRIYLPPTSEHAAAAKVPRPTDVVDQELGYDPRNLWTPQYGLARFSDLFTDRQLVAMTMFSDLVPEAREMALEAARNAGMPLGERLEAGGTGAHGYADAVATYLGLAVSRLADWSNSLCSWESSGEVSQHLFTGQKIGMAWDFTEANVLAARSSGSFGACVEAIAAPLERLGQASPALIALADARKGIPEGSVVNTDPPYYDNINYGNLTDFFYVWQRRALKKVHTSLFNTMLVPKGPEIVLNPYKNAPLGTAITDYEEGFAECFSKIREGHRADVPMVVYYASRQAERVSKGEISTSWSSTLTGLMRAGWSIEATWPIRSENTSRVIAHGANALSSTIVLALRPRREAAATTDRRGFMAALRRELPEALRKLQQGVIAPVDLPQAAIGPGMAVFSRYAAVIEADGSKMSVRSALARINEILDQVLNEQEGDFDATTRFGIAWYRQHGYATGRFGEADNLARARNTSVQAMDREGILTSRANKVTLIRPADLPWDYEVLNDERTSTWEVAHHLIRILERDGVAPAGHFLAAAQERTDGVVDPESVKELAFLLFSIADNNEWIKDALSFNALATSWTDIVDSSRAQWLVHGQGTFTFEEG